MKVRTIDSFFKNPKKKDDDEEEEVTVKVPTRKSSKKKKKDDQYKLEITPNDVSDEEDPLPRDVREKRSDSATKKRKARVLISDSEDDDDVVVKKASTAAAASSSKSSTKKQAEEKKAKVEEKKVAKSVDPSEFFGGGKIKREKKPEKEETKRNGASSSGSVSVSPSKKKVKQDSEEMFPESPIPSRRSSPRKSQAHNSPIVKEEKKSRDESPKKSHSVDKKKFKALKISDDEEEEEDFSPKNKTATKKTKKSEPTTPKASKSSKKVKPAVINDDDDDEEEDNFNPKKKAKKTPKKKVESEDKGKTPENKEKDQQKIANFQKFLAHQNAKPRNFGEKDIPTGPPDCLEGKTFVMTGILESLERESAKELIEKHGGRVTGAVSKKTTYLLVGDDAGASKTKKAKDLGTEVINEDALLNMIKNAAIEAGMDPFPGYNFEDMEEDEEPVASPVKVEEKDPASNKKKSKEQSPKKQQSEGRDSDSSSQKSKMKEEAPENSTEKISPSAIQQPLAAPLPPSLMWVDKYKPKAMKNIIGQVKDNSNAHKLLKWLRNWFINHPPGSVAKPAHFANKDPEGKTFKCALLSGPPGIGKTTTAHLACKDVGYDFFEMNASDTRNKRGLHEHVADALSNKTMLGSINNVTNKHVLIMDEVDGMSGNEDRGGVQELITLIKHSKVPIICICNDRNHPKIRSLANYCYDLRFYSPTMQELKGFVMSIAFKEKFKIESDQLVKLIKSANLDIRQILNQLELYKDSSSSNRLLDPKKDLRFGPFDICRKVFLKSEHEQMNIHEKTGLFFQDYSIGPLFVQENYAKWDPIRAKGNRYARLELVARTAASIAEGELAETLIRKTNNWSLLPVQAVMSSYIPGELMESNISGGTEFPHWLGKNSNKGKRHRLLQALHTHVHLEVSGSLEALNMDYLPYMRRKICGRLTDGDIEGAGEIMEKYALLRDDLDSIIDLSLWPRQLNPMDKLESKQKAAFTRTVNKETLPYANEKNVGKKRAAAAPTGYEGDEDDEEEVEEEEEDENPEKDGMIKMKKKPAAKKAASTTTKKETKKASGGGAKRAKK